VGLNPRIPGLGSQCEREGQTLFFNKNEVKFCFNFEDLKNP